MSKLAQPTPYPTPPSSATTPAKDSITITRCTTLQPEVYNFALAAYKLLFASRALNPTAIPADLTNFESTYCSSDSTGCFLVARDTSTGGEGEIVGITAYRPYIHRFKDDQGNLRPELLWEGKKVVEVVRLFVSPSCRGKGLAQRLIDAMIKEAERDGIEILYLHTQPFLTGAEKLWGKMGWKLIGRDTDQCESIHMVRKVIE